MIRRAYDAAAIRDISKTGFIECHGTGTPIGDPIEAMAVANVFGGDGVYIGSVKPNVGHSEGASGITSLIKTVLSLENRIIPPNIKFQKPNSKIPFETKRLIVPVEPTPWPDDRYERAGVNSFGIGGANVHVVLESARSFVQGALSMPSIRSSPYLLLHSAGTADSLRRQVTKTVDFATQHSDQLANVAYTLGSRREHLLHRSYTICEKDTPPSTSQFTKILPTPPAVVMIFTGQGAQWPQMGLELLRRNLTFGSSIRYMDKILQTLPDAPTWSILEELTNPFECSNVQKAAYSQPLCTAIQIALLDVLAAIDVRPYAVIGHSSGEIAAAYSAGKLSTSEAIIAAYYRGLIAESVSKPGGMAAIGMGWDEVVPYLMKGVVIACENSPSSVTISGEVEPLNQVLSRIKNARSDVLARTLKVDKAYHSHLMSEVGPSYHRLTRGHVRSQVALQKAIFFSSVTGKQIVDSDRLGPSYWQSNLESPVLFRTAVTELLKYTSNSASNNDTTRNLIFLEVGPHSSLAGPLRQTLAQSSLSSPYISCLTRNESASKTFLVAVGQLYLHNVSMNFNTLTNSSGDAKVVPDLPTYSWQHGASYLYESRLTKEWRLQRYVKHELLGIRVAESTSDEPSWRNMLHLDHVPWIRDHNIHGDIILPCAAYITMAGEASRQMLGSTKDSASFVGFGVKDFVLGTALVLNNRHPSEIITSLKRQRLTDSLDSSWYEFTVSSFNGSIWIKHCSGLVRARTERESAKIAIATQPRGVDTSKWYETMRRFGANYGPFFQGLSDISSSTTSHTATCKTIGTIPDDDDTAYSLHPTTIDFFLQLFCVSHAKGIARNINRMRVPTAIDEVDVFNSKNNIVLEVSSNSDLRGSIHGNGKGVAEDDLISLRMKGVQLSLLEGESDSENIDPHAAATLEWRPNIDFVDPARLIRGTVNRSLYVPTLRKLASLCIEEALHKLSDLDTTLPHLVKFRSWLREQSFGACGHSTQRDTNIRVLSDQLSTTSASPVVAAMLKVLENMAGIFIGKSEPLEVLLSEDTLTKLYNFMDQCDRTTFIRTLAHSKPNLRILEIGAGTGGTTNTILRDLVHDPNGHLMYSKYTFTDISAGFFPAAKERFKTWRNMEFKTLDISKDPLQQNFQAGSYDLILATNVLHATPELQSTLRHVRKLLRTDGRLLMQELCADEKSINFIMGILPGWWLGSEDGRASEPYVSPDRWQHELQRAGFEDPDAVILDDGDTFQMNAFIIARPLKESPKHREVTILCDCKSETLAKDYQAHLIRNGFTAELRQIGDPISRYRDVIALLDVQKPFFQHIDSSQYQSFQTLVSNLGDAGLFWVTQPSQVKSQNPHFAQILGIARVIRSELAIDFATCEVDNIEGTLEQVIETFTKFQCRIKEDTLDPEYEYVISDGVVYTGRFFPMALKQELVNLNTHKSESCALCLTVGKHGRLNTLGWSPCGETMLKDDEIKLDTRAVGVNFKDVLIAMGIVGSTSAGLGIEASGIVSKAGKAVTDLSVGDRVFVLGSGCFSTSIVAPSNLCVKIPDTLSFEDAATMPCVFATVIYSLINIGRLDRGQSVLIHSACGGVGIAAIQICRMLGAEIFATVGSDEKVEYLMTTYDIPRRRIFNSRNPSFFPDIMTETSGRGIDLVLNSLSGELLHASWNCVAEFGSMIEIGKRDFIGKGKLAMNLFEANRSYCGVDLGHLIEVKPVLGKRLLQSIVQYFEGGHIQPVRPTRIFPAASVEDCFRYMQKGTHMGKIVVSMPTSSETSHSASTLPKMNSLDSNVSYLLIGGLGGLGKAVSTWMVECGARHLVYLSRSAGSDPDDAKFLEELNSQGCTTTIVKGSVANVSDVEIAVSSGKGPLKGVLQMSMVLRDQAFSKMTHEEWTAAVSPKVQGTWNLHHSTRALNLDFFVLFSSVSGTVGQPGQANYASANTFLDAFVQYRHSQQLPASVLDIGVMEDSGYLAKHTAVLKKLHASGSYGIREPELLDALTYAISLSPPHPQPGNVGGRYVHESQVVIGLRTTLPLSRPENRVIWKNDRRMAFYWNKNNDTEDQADSSQISSSKRLEKFVEMASGNPAMLKEKCSISFLSRQIAAKIHALLLYPMENEDEIDTSLSLQDIGLDSLIAIEVRAWWKQTLRFDISVLEMLGMGSIEALGHHAANGLLKRFEADTGDEEQHREYLAMKAP